MSDKQAHAQRLLRSGATGLQAVLIVLALSVPVWAILSAISAVWDPANAEDLKSLVNLSRWMALLRNTAIVCGVAVVTAGVLGALLGLLSTRTDMPGHRLLTGAALYGACVPVYISTVFFFAVISKNALIGAGVTCGFLYGLAYTPLATLILGAAFRSSDRGLEEQALLDTGPWSVLWRVTIPQAVWGFVVLGLVVLLFVATDFTITDILTVRTFAEECYSQYQLYRCRLGPLLTAVPILIVLAVLLVSAQVRYRFFGEQSPWQFGTRPRVLSLGSWRWVCAGLCVVAVVGGAGVPTAVLLSKVESAAGFATSYVGVQPDLLTSLSLGPAGATIVVLGALWPAWAVARGGRLARWGIGSMLVLLLALPAPVVGISLIEMLNRPGPCGWLYDRPLVVVFGYFVRFLPIGILLLIPGARRVPHELEWAARVDGCDWVGVQRHVRWPAMVTDIGIVWLVVLVLCFAELGTTNLVFPPDWATASVRAFTLIHNGVYRDLAVLALVSIAFILLPWVLLAWLLKRTLTGARVRA